MGTTIGLEANQGIFLNEGSHNQSTGYDTDILPKLDVILSDEHKRRAVFIHLMGSHIAYPARYPSNMAFFGNATTSDRYDNSIRFTDYVLSQIFWRFPPDGLLFTYVSDHGELVSETVVGHGYPISFRDEFEIPMLFWAKDQHKLNEIELDVGEGTINGESYYSLVRYLVGIDTNPDISYSDYVSATMPANRVAYSSELQEFSEVNFQEQLKTLKERMD